MGGIYSKIFRCTIVGGILMVIGCTGSNKDKALRGNDGNSQGISTIDVIENEITNIGGLKFKDANFASCVMSTVIGRNPQGKRTYADANGDGVLTLEEALKIKAVRCNSQGIRSLEGIEQLKELEYVSCSANGLDSMPDFSSLKKLTTLYCSKNAFSDVDCPQLKKLEKLNQLPESDRVLRTLEVQTQRDGRVLSCDQVSKVAIVPVRSEGGSDLFYGNTLNDIWGFQHDNEDYIVYGDVTDIFIMKVEDKSPYVTETARIARGKDGAPLWTEPNHSTWGEYRYYRSGKKAYLYASSEGNYVATKKGLWASLMIIDITDISNPQVVPLPSGFHIGLNSIHNITLDEKRGLLIAFGGKDEAKAKDIRKRREAGEEVKEDASWIGARFYSLRDPENPLYLTTVGDYYVHDGQIKTELDENGILLSSNLYLAHGSTAIHWDASEMTSEANRFGVYDVSQIDEEIPGQGKYTMLVDHQYPYGYAHNIWVTDDNNYVMLTGETSVDNQLSIWGLGRDSKGVVNETYFLDGLNLQGAALAHNAFIVGSHVYVSHYTKGVVVLGIGENRHGEVVLNTKWSYDTHLQDNSGNMDGCWGVYPFSGKSKYFFGTDSSSGLHVFKKSDQFLKEEQQL